MNSIKDFWDRSKSLNLKNKIYRNYVSSLIKRQLKEDKSTGDITSKTVLKNQRVIAEIVAKENGIVAGIEEISLITSKEKLIIFKKGGSRVKKGQVILKIIGNAKKILGYERTLLNLIQRMSGIATETNKITQLVGKNCYVSATRKTLFNLVDKKAVSIGNGLTHRLDLSDFILIKDNHLKINNLEKTIRLVEKSKSKFIEIEVANKKQALKLTEIINKLNTKKKFAILFDNMSPQLIRITINEIKNNKIRILYEASGGINKKNIKNYSKTGVDIISLGSLTHSVKAFDISMRLSKVF